MSNVSDWKGFEQMVADALGGQRRDFSQFASARARKGGSTVTDVRWPTAVKEKYPFIRNVKVECKKKKTMNIYNEMALARLKYADTKEAIIVLACKRPNPGSKKKSVKASWEKRRQAFIKKAKKLGISQKDAEDRLTKGMLLRPLVCVDLDFFAILFKYWKEFELVKAKSLSRRHKSS